MKIFLYSSVLALIVCGLSYGQATLTDLPPSVGPLQTGFAIITSLSSNGNGLSVSETLVEQTEGGFFQTSVAASPLITLTDVVVVSDPTSGVNTGIAIVNPNSTPAVVTFSLQDRQGVTAATRVITMDSRQQISLFVTQLFAGSPVFDQPMTGLMFISSDLPVAVVAFAFDGASFTALPVPTQLNTNILNTNILNTNNVFAVALPSTNTNNVIAVALPSTVFATATIPTTVFSIPVTPTFNGIPTPPTILPTPPTFAVANVPVPITNVPTALPTSTGVLTTGSQFSTVPTVPGLVTTTPSIFSPPSIAFFPQSVSGVSGIVPAVLPQVVTGAGWRTQVTIVNQLPAAQTVRVGFFNASGGPLSVPFDSTSDIVIPPGSVATIVL